MPAPFSFGTLVPQQTYSVASSADLIAALTGINASPSVSPVLVNLTGTIAIAGGIPALGAAAGQQVLFYGGAAGATITSVTNPAWPLLNVTSGQVVLQNLTLVGGVITGGAGGNSSTDAGTGGGGGGGLGSGGALFVGAAANVTLLSCALNNNQANGGAGGVAQNASGYEGPGGSGGAYWSLNVPQGGSGGSSGDDGSGGSFGTGGGGGGGADLDAGNGGGGGYGAGGGGGGGSPGSSGGGADGGGVSPYTGGQGGYGSWDGGGGGGGAGLGGAIFVLAGGALTLIDTTTSANSVNGGAGGGGDVDGNAGGAAGSAIFLQGNTDLSVEVDSGTCAFATDTLATDGTGTLTKTGAGTWSLAAASGSNPAPILQGAAPIVVAAGTLSVAGPALGASACCGSGPITVASGATLSAQGPFANVCTVSGTLQGTGPLRFQALQFAAGAALLVDLSNPIQAVSIGVAANLQLTIGNASNLPGGTYPLLQSDEPISVDQATLDTWNVELPDNLCFAGLSLVQSGSSYEIQVAAPAAYIVTSAADDGSTGTLRDAITQANQGNTLGILIDPGLTIALESQLFLNASIWINGSGSTIAGNGADRLFFVAGGEVTLMNLTLSSGCARGGDGAGGGGGGAGLGGALFVANGTAINGSNIAAAANVTAINVTFSGNSAVGGTGADGAAGGGGGMGGDGGNGDAQVFGVLGAGGGFGVGADGGSAYSTTPPPASANGGTGAFLGGSPGGAATPAGAVPGTCGGGGAGPLIPTDGSTSYGGGGGVGGGVNYQYQVSPGGGWGGGGCSVDYPYVRGGIGGFGGGGGGPGWSNIPCGGDGGFGGGAGLAATPGFGGGGSGQGGGGGLGAGGAIFVQQGAQLTLQGCVFTDNVVTGGGPAGALGKGIGRDVFLGGNVVFAGAATTASSGSLGLGGGGGDPDNTSDPNAQGGIIVDAGTELTLSAPCDYVGTTQVLGTLNLSAPQTCANFVVSGGTLNITTPQTCATSVVVSAGSLNLNGKGTLLPNANVAVSGTGLLTGDTGMESASIGAGGTVMPGTPGQSVALLTIESPTWLPGGNYNWQIADATGAPGVGYSQIVGSGSLDLSSLSANDPFNLNLWSLSATGPNTNGPAANFDPTVAQEWLIATSRDVTSEASFIQVNVAPANGTGGFVNALAGGSFSLEVKADRLSLVLKFTPAS